MVSIEILSVRDPVWANVEHTAIKCLNSTNTLKGEHPFSASPIDPEEHGRRLFQELVDGKHGPIMEYEPKGPIPDGESPKTNLLPFPEIETFLEEANAENAAGSVRGIILVWAAMIDELLKRLLIAKGVEAERDSFEGRIKCAFKHDLIENGLNEQLLAIKELRNAAGHRWSLSFDDAAWRKEALKNFRTLHKYDKLFVFHEDLDFLTRQVFGCAAGKLTMDLANKVHELNGTL